MNVFIPYVENVIRVENAKNVIYQRIELMLFVMFKSMFLFITKSLF